MNKKVLVFALALVLIASFALSGCSNTAKPASDVIKIGWVGPLSGDQAIWGEAELNTLKMMIEDQNAAGGVLGKKLEAVGYDTKADPQEAVIVTKRLTGEDKVIAIIGPNSSGSAIPMASILESAKVAGIATVATNPKVTVLDGKVKPYNFRVCFIDPYQGAVAAGYSYDVLNAKNAAVLYDVGDDYSQGLTQYFEEYYAKKGGTIVSKEAFKSGDVDFRPQLSKIKATNPEVLFLPTFFKEAALISKQARELGITAILLGGDAWPSDQLVPMAGEAIEGSYFINHLDVNDPDVQEFKNKYKAKFGKEVEMGAFMVHDAFLSIIGAIERAGVADSEKVAAELENTKLKGISGNINISKETHNPEGKDAAVIKIIDGKFIFQQKYAAK